MRKILKALNLIQCLVRKLLKPKQFGASRAKKMRH